MVSTDVTVGAAFIQQVQFSLQSILEASAQITNALNRIDDMCDEPEIQPGLKALRRVSASLAMRWEELGRSLCDYDLMVTVGEVES